jgi:hypothetical protein
VRRTLHEDRPPHVLIETEAIDRVVPVQELGHGDEVWLPDDERDRGARPRDAPP